MTEELLDHLRATIRQLTQERDQALANVAMLRNALSTTIAASERERRAEDAWGLVCDEVHAGGVSDEVLKAAGDELEDATASMIICEHAGRAVLAALEEPPVSSELLTPAVALPSLRPLGPIRKPPIDRSAHD